METNTENVDQNHAENEAFDAAISDAVSESIGNTDCAVEDGANENVSSSVETNESATNQTNQNGNDGDGEKPAIDSDSNKQNISPNQEQTVDAGDPIDEVSETIKAMEDEGGYDPKLMKLLSGLIAENKKLRSAGESAERVTFFDKQFGSLDEGVRSLIDDAHKSKLMAKFDMLNKGYKASGAKISREDVFQEAAKLAIGDLIEKASEERKTSALDKRRNLTLARPGGEIGQRRHNGPVTEADIADEIWDQINS